MASDDEIDRRLDRIDAQLEKFSNLVTTVVLVEERMAAIFEKADRQDKRLDSHSERLRKLELGTIFTAALQRVIWLIVGASAVALVNALS